MNIQLTKLSPLIGLIKRRLLAISLLLCLAWTGWVGWQIWQQWPDRVLPADRITARELKVNDAQLQKLKLLIENYQKPADSLPLSGL